MAALDNLEKSLEGVFVKSAPKLPEGGKRVLVQWLPLVNYANQLSQAYGGSTVAVRELTGMVWLGLVVLAIEGVLFLMAFSGTRARSKRGWDLMFFALLVNLVYGVLVIF